MTADSLRALSARIAALEVENATLREQLGLELDASHVSAMRARGMGNMQARLVLVLAKRAPRLVNFALFEAVAPPKDHANCREPHILAVVVSRVRKRLPAGAIRTVPLQGYAMTPIGCAAVAEWLGDAA